MNRLVAVELHLGIALVIAWLALAVAHQWEEVRLAAEMRRTQERMHSVTERLHEKLDDQCVCDDDGLEL